LLERLASTTVLVIEPGLLLAEVVGAISRETHDSLRARVYLELLHAIPSLTCAPFDNALAEATAYLATDYALRGADAVYVATARQHNSALVTLDREVRERVATIVRVLTPEAALAELGTECDTRATRKRGRAGLP
jgi:predicted nucleic acid-binding protein